MGTSSPMGKPSWQTVACSPGQQARGHSSWLGVGTAWWRCSVEAGWAWPKPDTHQHTTQAPICSYIYLGSTPLLPSYSTPLFPSSNIKPHPPSSPWHEVQRNLLVLLLTMCDSGHGLRWFLGSCLGNSNGSSFCISIGKHYSITYPARTG